MTVERFAAILQERGWNYTEKCRCGGVLKYKYSNANYKGLVFEWWYKYSKFTVKRLKRSVITLSNLDLVEEKLNTL
jgi:hypothetical protein